MKKYFSLKYAITVSFFFLIVSSLVLWVFIEKNEVYKSHVLSSEIINTRTFKNMIQDEIISLQKEIYLMAREPYFKDFVKSDNQIITPPIKKRLFQVMYQNENLLGSSFIYANGFEIVKLTYNPPRIEFTDKENFRYLGNDQIFKDAKIDSKNSVFIRKLPNTGQKFHNSKFLMATPIYKIIRKKLRFRGVLTFNFTIDKIYKRFCSYYSESLSNKILFGEDKNWHLEFDSTKNSNEFDSHEIKTLNSINFDNNWEIINKNTNGNFKTDDFYITYNTIKIFTRTAFYWKTNPQNIETTEWKLISFLPLSVLNKYYNDNIWIIILIIFTILIVSIIFIIILSLNSHNRSKQTELELESKVKDSLLLEALSVGVALIETENLKIIKVNNAFSDISGYSKEELKTKTFDELLYESDAESSETKNSYSDGDRIFRSILRRKDGRTIFVLVSRTDFNLLNKKQTILSIRDITEMRRINEENRMLRNHFQSVYDSANFMIFALDKSECYLSFNKKHWDLTKLRWNKEIKIGDYFFDKIFDAGFNKKVKDLFLRIYNEETIEIKEKFIFNGKEELYEIVGGLLKNEKDEVIGITVFVKSISI